MGISGNHNTIFYINVFRELGATIFMVIPPDQMKFNTTNIYINRLCTSHTSIPAQHVFYADGPFFPSG